MERGGRWAFGGGLGVDGRLVNSKVTISAFCVWVRFFVEIFHSEKVWGGDGLGASYSTQFASFPGAGMASTDRIIG